mmetsp:Transcript_15814/g.36046  ORF Transcript_15814/g.36046 Transcript_15814/m.36046 type:complete len:98 (-) Transcript_15814:220-513(-)
MFARGLRLTGAVASAAVGASGAKARCHEPARSKPISWGGFLRTETGSFTVGMRVVVKGDDISEAEILLLSRHAVMLKYPDGRVGICDPTQITAEDDA